MNNAPMTFPGGGGGTGATIDETSFTIADNQSSAADVTSLVLNSASFLYGRVDYAINRNGTIEMGTLWMYYDGTNWNLSQGPQHADDAGVTFSIVAGTGQVQYTSTSTGQTGAMKFIVWGFAA